jgi:hypothetical protein
MGRQAGRQAISISLKEGIQKRSRKTGRRSEQRCDAVAMNKPLPFPFPFCTWFLEPIYTAHVDSMGYGYGYINYIDIDIDSIDLSIK